MRKRNALLAAGAGLAALSLTAGSAVADPAASLHGGMPVSINPSGAASQGLVDHALAGSFVMSRRTAIKETRNIRTVLPFAKRWRNAIAHRDLPASLQAGEDYEAAWQAVEVYINHRSLPLYTDLEVNTQFAIDAGLAQPQPDWPALLELADHLREGLDVAIDFISSQPPLSPLFDDLVPLRGTRARLLITRDALTAGDLAKAKTTFNEFEARFPSVESLIALRSPTAVRETKDALSAAAAKFADPGATAADLTPLVATLLDRYGFGVNLLNAAARAADPRKTTVTDADKTALGQLNNVALGLKRGLPKFPTDLPGAAAGGATGPGSDFALVQPTLESKARLVNTAATFRGALAAYQTLVLANPTPSTAQVAAANKRALEQVAIAQQTLIGQFWTDPALQAFLRGLPTT